MYIVIQIYYDYYDFLQIFILLCYFNCHSPLLEHDHLISKIGSLDIVKLNFIYFCPYILHKASIRRENFCRSASVRIFSFMWWKWFSISKLWFLKFVLSRDLSILANLHMFNFCSNRHIGSMRFQKRLSKAINLRILFLDSRA